jgi:hypothetical protein
MADRSMSLRALARAVHQDPSYLSKILNGKKLTESGEPEQAVAAVRQVVPVAVQSGSARMRAELGVLRNRMEQWRGLPPWRDLEEALAVVPRLRKERER